ncbi:hypothetical protein EYB25_007618 [Talaromyces marneffei]|uniref:CHAT domain-containing protein n=1 Tax=Talaromyces marneffei (strain ATCC 18224 / CBS 334.59 / QM 7333) TaxID=441960 RepID=B6QPR6_TALMQ|nr:conserved hypothetical protein [Talaromyces marneffei ATCC 18224]KAE8549103.1 hypothetical protein EYB25_007618 [Talaromyces marneffei]
MDIQDQIEDDIQSLFLDEYRGDLRQAYNDIIQHESQLNINPDESHPEQRAYFLRSKIQVHMLRGRLNDAYTALDEFKTFVDDNVFSEPKRLASYWGLRYAAAKLLVDYYRRYPPCIRYQHESQSPTNTALIEGITGPNEITAELNQNIQKYCANATEEETTNNQMDMNICIFFLVLLHFPQQLRLVTLRHSAYPDGNWKPNDGKTPEEVIASVAPYLHNFVQRAPLDETTDLTSLYAQRLNIELHYAMESPSLRTLLPKLFHAHERFSDQAGMANSKLIEGDTLYSPPFTSPIIQNLVPVPGSHAAGDHNIWDTPEVKIALKDSEEAFRCYEEALELFETSNSSRGKAAVHLRLASILHARSYNYAPADNERAVLLQDASEHCDKSLTLFDMDEANAQIVKANQILIEISKGHTNMADLQKRAGEIGKWGRECQNELIAFHIGTVMIRFARREWGRYSRFDTANACYECAYVCCTELGARLPAFIALFARAALQNEMNNIAATAVLADQCIVMFDNVVQSLNQQIQNINAETPIGKIERQHLLTRKYEFMSTFNNSISRILARRDSLDTLENYRRWKEKFRWYEQNDESFAFVRGEPENDSGPRQSDVAKKYFGQSLDDILKVFALDNDISDKFWAADMEFNQAILDGNMDKAESVMHDFIKTAQGFKRVYSQYMYKMIAYGRIGDVLKMQEILDSVTDSELFNTRLEEFLNGKNVDMFFSSLANNAIFVCVNATDWKRGLRVLDLVLKIRPNYFDESPSESPIDLSIRQAHAATIYLNNAQPEVAFRMLLKARRLIELRRSQASDMDVKVGVLSRGLIETFLQLVIICLECAKLHLPLSILNSYDHSHPQVSWEEHALLFMEEARARSLIDSLISSAQQQSDEEGRRRMSESIYKRRALTHLLSIHKRTENQDKELNELAREVERLDVGTWSSSANDLMDTMNSAVLPLDLYGHLSDDTVVIEASFNISGCILMAITKNGIQSYETNNIRDIDIRKWATELMQIMRDMSGLREPEEEDRKARMEELSGQISDVLLRPFAAIIREKSQIIFSLSQPLTAFPVSALVFDGKPLVLHAAVSQTPSLTALYHLSKRRAASAMPTVSVFTKALAGDQSSESDRATKETFLPMAGVEAISISNLFSTWPIEASNLSRAQFRDHIQGHTSILHIGTHGTVNAGSPLLSSISIGEDFRVIDMSPIQSRANLIVFAACLSGLGRATAGNDVLGFTHVVLGTGCQAYIGTLFEISDFASMILMTLFYRQIKDTLGLSLAEALRRAQVEFLHFDDEKATAFLDQLLEAWDATSMTESGIKSPEDFVPDGKYLLTLQKMMLPQIDWTSPIFWASFALMGYGDFCFSYPG